MSRPVGALAMRDEALRDALFSPPLRRRLAELLAGDLDTVITDFHGQAGDLGQIEILLTGWGCPRVDAAVLDRMPRLRLIAHTAGTVKGHLDAECWQRGIAVSTAAAANAVPVAEFTVARIVLANKAIDASVRHFRRHRDRSWPSDAPTVGNYGRTVGIIGASTIGRLVLERLRTYDLDVLLADPTIDSATAAGLGAELVTLDDLMSRSDVVSLHAPILPQTIGMIGAEQLAAMPDGATFINTARGVLVDHDALRRELQTGRIEAVLDVTDPEPLPRDDVLWELPNVILTPHVAGSMGTELFRMAALAVDEVERHIAGRPLQHEVSAADLARMA